MTLLRELFGGIVALDDESIHAAIDHDLLGQLEVCTRSAGDAPLVSDEA